MATESTHILDIEPFTTVAYRLSEELLGKQTRQFPAIPVGQSAMVSKMDESTSALLEDFNRLIGDDLPRSKPVYREDLDTLVFVGLLAEMADLTIDQFLDLTDEVMSEAVGHSLPILSEMSGDDVKQVPEMLRSGGNSLRDQILVLVNEPVAIQAAHNLAVALGSSIVDEARGPASRGIKLAGQAQLRKQMMRNPAEKRLMKNKGLALRMARVQAKKMGLSSSVAKKMAGNPSMVLGGSLG